MPKKYLFLILGMIAVVALYFVFMNRDDTTIILEGDSTITIDEGFEYTEPGYFISNSDNDVIGYYVNEENNIDITVPGEYTVKYSLYNNKDKLIKEVIRKVIVQELNLKDISLNLIGDSTEYYFKGTYSDKGATAKKSGEDITELIKVTNNVKDNKIGEYEVIYRIGNENKNVEKKRKVIIDELKVKENNIPSKKQINLEINNDGYAYTMLPNNKKETSKYITYNYNTKGIYKFIVYLKSGSKEEYNVNIETIDTIGPTGTCTATMIDKSFEVIVDAKDESGIKKYQYDNVDYTTNKFNISNMNSNVKIKVFDNNDNVSELVCKNIYGSGIKTTLKVSEHSGYFKCNSDVTEANKELDDIVKSYGEKTRSAVAAAALFLTNYKYNVAYQWGGKYMKKGLNPEWGCSKYTSIHNGRLVCTKETGSNSCEAGLDCTGFTSWAFVQAGFDPSIIRESSQSTGSWGNFNASRHKYAFSSSNLAMANQIKPGDLVWREGHVGIVIGVSDKTIQIANELGPIIVQINNKSNGACISGQAGFTHFVLFDEFYNMYGSNT